MTAGRRCAIAFGAVLLAACASKPAQQTATSVSPAPSQPRPEVYTLVYTSDDHQFIIDGKRYDAQAVTGALALPPGDGRVHVIVVRDGGGGLTIGDMLNLLPALATGKTCLYVQQSNGKVGEINLQARNGESETKPYCPSQAVVANTIGTVAPASAPPT